MEWAQLTQGTDMALRPETAGKVARYLLDLGRWNTFEETEVAWISFTPYRVFWRPATSLEMAAQLAKAGIPEADGLRAMAAGEDTPPQGCRFWPSAETLIFRGPGYYCALIMASKNRHPISYAYKNRFLRIGNRWYYGRDGHLVIASAQRSETGSYSSPRSPVSLSSARCPARFASSRLKNSGALLPHRDSRANPLGQPIHAQYSLPRTHSILNEVTFSPSGWAPR